MISTIQSILTGLIFFPNLVNLFIPSVMTRQGNLKTSPDKDEDKPSQDKTTHDMARKEKTKQG
jgi:hypothetical protein